MKGKNRLILNVLSPSTNRRRKFAIRKENGLSQQLASTRSQNDANTATADTEDIVFQDSDDHITLETDYTKRKLRLAENWTEVRGGVYTTMISSYAHYDAECLFAIIHPVWPILYELAVLFSASHELQYSIFITVLKFGSNQRPFYFNCIG